MNNTQNKAQAWAFRIIIVLSVLIWTGIAYYFFV